MQVVSNEKSKQRYACGKVQKTLQHAYRAVRQADLFARPTSNILSTDYILVARRTYCDEPLSETSATFSCANNFPSSSDLVSFQ